ncbi:EamA family transporter [Photobacterium sp. TY1-4]|uniref:EamA family transporter n=1 Tax=Photobacterium sp. TY1-4 TaxID=2899122 RepID=UPI0021BEF57C|nr:EamA family transporter [Photobacterium sp. TY1-4]UXI01379.1 EamA family transporter [Photobacterium sp. TY1-4]
MLSAVIHAAWNLLGKSRKPSPAFFAVASLGAGGLLIPVMAAVLGRAGVLPGEFWWVLLGSGFCQMVYLASLARAYQQADVGVVYPIARALPVLMVATVSSLLGQGLPPLAWFGMGLVTVGCLLVPVVSFRRWRWQAYGQAGCLWALLAALGTAGYSVLDDRALLLMAGHFSPDMAPALVAFTYLGMQFLVTGAWLMLWCLHAAGRAQLRQSGADWRVALLTGIMMGGTYGLVLLAMSLTENVSYVVALRQLSIPVGVALGVWLLREPAHRPRLIGASLVCAGLVAVSLK